MGTITDPKEVLRLIILQRRRCLRRTDPSILTEGFCLELVKIDPRCLEFIPTDRQTIKVCYEAIEQNNCCIAFVKNKTEDVCLKSLEKDYEGIFFIEKRFQTEAICLKAIEKFKKFGISKYSKSTIREFLNAIKVWTDVVYFECIIFDYNMLRLIERPLTEEDYREAVRMNIECAKVLPFERLNPSFVEEVFDINPDCFPYIHGPENYPEICYRAIDKNPFHIQYIPPTMEEYPDLAITACDNNEKVIYHVEGKDLVDQICEDLDIDYNPS